VVQDYQSRLHEGVVECQKTQASYYQLSWDGNILCLSNGLFFFYNIKNQLFLFLTDKNRSQLPILGRPLPDVKSCQLNVSQCDVSETSSRFIVNIYNSLARPIDKYVRIPVASAESYQVLDPDGMYRIT
jgi:lysosomal alpha-mannosidase